MAVSWAIAAMVQHYQSLTDAVTAQLSTESLVAERLSVRLIIVQVRQTLVGS